MRGKNILLTGLMVFLLAAIWIVPAQAATVDNQKPITSISEFEFDDVDGRTKIIVIRQVFEAETQVAPRRFPSAVAAEKWVAENLLPFVMIAGKDGRITFNDNTHDPRADCDDYADGYEAMASAQNISLWQCPVTDGKVWGIRVTPETRGNHVGMWTKIDGFYYYIESSPTKDKWLFTPLLRAD